MSTAAPSITDCAICKDEFAEGDECIVLPCKHLFHEADCALPWLKQNGTCPVWSVLPSLSLASPSPR